MRLYRRPVIGLVLSGGGARGLAHIGVLKVFERENIPIDCLAGASMGGIIAAACAVGLSAAEMEAEALKLTRPRNVLKLVDFAVPRHGLLTGGGVHGYLNKLLGETLTFDDLSAPLALTAVDLISGKEIVLRGGSVVDATRATSAIPAVFEPVEVENYRLVDGGLLNNLPVDVARQLGAEVVIAVNVRLDYYDLALVDNPKTPIATRIAHSAWRAESIIGAILDEPRLKKARPDLILHPKLGGDITILGGFGRAAEIIAAGEKAADEAIDQLRKITRPRLRPKKAPAVLKAPHRNPHPGERAHG